MKKFLAMTLTIIMTCAALTACGDTAQPSEESKTETTTTTTTETTTETSLETEETTTTTTATETETTTTTEAAEESETATETEAPSENSEETGIVTMEDNPEGMYPMKECFRRAVENFSENVLETTTVVVSIQFDEKDNSYVATCDDGTKYVYMEVGGGLNAYESQIMYDPQKLRISLYPLEEGYSFEVTYDKSRE
ncbi:hypothetical protein [Ruminococcus sp.]|uniref:hypothetical protein n=1 Tax=Ruminococcus sp. TaxID=41978 RepID=UPI0025E0B31B|nr:hypothetical protein [Ruminococcus sp.]MBQ8967893.1 hypothetical protein [Ruminococcus sp.]